MNMTHRDYSEQAGDFNRLCRFISAHNAPGRPRSTWPLGRIVDWKYGLYDNKLAYPAFCDQNAHLWFDAFGELAGFVVSESGDAGFAILTLDGYRFLYSEMLEWVLETWRERGPGFSTEVSDYLALEARVLECHGFQRKSVSYTRRFDLTGELLPRFPLEAGFTIVDMAAPPDLPADASRGRDYASRERDYLSRQRLLRDNAFSDKEPTPAELRRELLFYNYSQRGPIYHPQTDLCVMAPDGRFVAGCEALIDAHNAEAEIERVCTHSDFRKRGFARAVIQECLYRLRDIGLRSAYITGFSEAAIALYGSMGAVDEVTATEFALG